MSPDDVATSSTTAACKTARAMLVFTRWCLQLQLRFILPVLPALNVPAASALVQLWQRGMGTRFLAVASVAACAALSAGFAAAAFHNYPGACSAAPCCNRHTMMLWPGWFRVLPVQCNSHIFYIFVFHAQSFMCSHPMPKYAVCGKKVGCKREADMQVAQHCVGCTHITGMQQMCLCTWTHAHAWQACRASCMSSPDGITTRCDQQQPLATVASGWLSSVLQCRDGALVVESL